MKSIVINTKATLIERIRAKKYKIHWEYDCPICGEKHKEYCFRLLYSIFDVEITLGKVVHDKVIKFIISLD